MSKPSREFIREFERNHGKTIQIGEHWHYCYDWDGMPIDEHCLEYDGCHCYDNDKKLKSAERDRQRKEEADHS